MNEIAPSKDYSLTGPLNAHAVQVGLANANWYKTDIPRQRMKQLMQRSDEPATRDTLIWIGLLIATGGLGAYFWPTWWCLPFFAVYGVLYGSAGDSRWHECGHGTAFKTQWKNEAVYQLACFFMVRNPVVWRWSHSRHHTDTIIVGRDPEIITPRPPKVRELLMMIVGLDVPKALLAMLRYAFVGVNEAEKDFIPESERAKVAGVARIWTAIYVLVVALCVWSNSLLPLMLIGLPRLYGAWHHILTGVTQHIGLAEDVLDHRLNCRTMYINPFSRILEHELSHRTPHVPDGAVSSAARTA